MPAKARSMTIHRKRPSFAVRRADAAQGIPGDYRVPFAACYAYSPKGCAQVSVRSRLLCARVKRSNTRWLRCYAARVNELVRGEGTFRGFFNRQTVLVPVPKGPSTQASDWSAWHVALAINATGLAGSVWAGLSRIKPIKRSSSAWMWERPTVQQHYHSLSVAQSATPPTEIVLIDDVITKGRTLIAAAMRLRNAFPCAQIRAFALVRTLGLTMDIERLIDPCQGEICWDGEDARRDP